MKMELPITRPSRIAYADELNFSELLGELKSTRYNGFIRVTYELEEGHILFKEGKQVAASYDKDSKVNAIKKIKLAADNARTLVEVFDLRESQINYLMDINKMHLIDSGSEVHDMLDELKKTKSEDEIKPHSSEKEKSEVVEAEIPDKPSESKSEVIEAEIPDKPSESKSENGEEARDKLQTMSETWAESNPAEETQQEAKIKSEDLEISKESEVVLDETNISQEVAVKTEEPQKAEANEDAESEKPEVEDEPVDRAELMKRYGLKDVGEEEVENILDSYKGGSLSDEDVEKIELTLMNKIKKSILGIPKIKGTEVMVFLDNASELTGNINIITEYESKGFLSRIMGESNDLDNLKRQIINITQIEIRKSFRGYPEIVDDFKINVEVS
jgi:hypothetical protein